MDFSGSYVKAGIGGSFLKNHPIGRVYLFAAYIVIPGIVLAFVCGFKKNPYTTYHQNRRKFPSIGRHENQLRPAPAAWIPTGIRFEDQEDREGGKQKVNMLDPKMEVSVQMFFLKSPFVEDLRLQNLTQKKGPQKNMAQKSLKIYRDQPLIL